MKPSIAFLSFMTFGFFATAVTADCTPVELNFDGKVGKPGWLVLNKAITQPAMFREAPEYVVPLLEQTGPLNWRAITGQTLPQGTPGRISSAIRDDGGYVRYFRFELEDGTEVVIDAINVMAYDYTQCDAATVLFASNVQATPLGKMRGIPMIADPDARPLEFSGDWLPADAVSSVSYLNCHAFGPGVLGSESDFVECAPVWTDELYSHRFEMHRRFFYENGDLVQILQKPAIN